MNNKKKKRNGNTNGFPPEKIVVKTIFVGSANKMLFLHLFLDNECKIFHSKNNKEEVLAFHVAFKPLDPFKHSEALSKPAESLEDSSIESLRFAKPAVELTQLQRIFTWARIIGSLIIPVIEVLMGTSALRTAGAVNTFHLSPFQPVMVTQLVRSEMMVLGTFSFGLGRVVRLPIIYEEHVIALPNPNRVFAPAQLASTSSGRALGERRMVVAEAVKNQTEMVPESAPNPSTQERALDERENADAKQTSESESKEKAKQTLEAKEKAEYFAEAARTPKQQELFRKRAKAKEIKEQKQLEYHLPIWQKLVDEQEARTPEEELVFIAEQEKIDSERAIVTAQKNETKRAIGLQKAIDVQTKKDAASDRIAYYETDIGKAEARRSASELSENQAELKANQLEAYQQSGGKEFRDIKKDNLSELIVAATHNVRQGVVGVQSLCDNLNPHLEPYGLNVSVNSENQTVFTNRNDSNLETTKGQPGPALSIPSGTTTLEELKTPKNILTNAVFDYNNNHGIVMPYEQMHVHHNVHTSLLENQGSTDLQKLKNNMSNLSAGSGTTHAYMHAVAATEQNSAADRSAANLLGNTVMTQNIWVAPKYREFTTRSVLEDFSKRNPDAYKALEMQADEVKSLNALTNASHAQDGLEVTATFTELQAGASRENAQKGAAKLEKQRLFATWVLQKTIPGIRKRS